MTDQQESKTLKIFYALLMIGYGAMKTILTAIMVATKATGVDNTDRYFEHPYVKLLAMMTGEALCLVGYFFKQPSQDDRDQEIPVNFFILSIPALFDMAGSVMANIGMILTRDAGAFSLAMSSNQFFNGLLSLLVFRRQLAWFQWAGMAIITGGLFVKASVMMPSIFPGYKEQDFCQQYLNLTSVDDVVSEPSLDNATILTGYCCYLVGNFMHAVMLICEEKYIRKFNISPLKIVCAQGLFGVSATCILLWPLYFVTVDGLFGYGPDQRLEDAIDGFTQIFSGSSWLLVTTLVLIVICGLYNYSRCSLTKELNATTSAVLDNIKLVIVWAFFLLPLGPNLCRVQKEFHWTSLVGLVIVVIGIAVYNDIYFVTAVRKITGESGTTGQYEQLVTDGDEDTETGEIVQRDRGAKPQ